MTGEDVIRAVEETCSEWIEMSNDPGYFVAGILAKEVIRLHDHIEYLERRIEHGNCTRF